MIFVHNELVREMLTVGECIDVLERAFRQLDTGESMERPRIDMYIPCSLDNGYLRWGTSEGTNDGIFAIRMKSDVISWPESHNGLAFSAVGGYAYRKAKQLGRGRQLPTEWFLHDVRN